MYYSQKDPRWAAKKVGFGNLTFAQVGCAITSIANKLKYDGVTMTPIEVNTFAKNCGAFNVDMLNFSTLAKALGYDYVKQTKKPEGRHIVETNYYKNVGVPQHFVFVKEDGKRIDPLDLNPSWETNNYPIISYRVFSKKQAQELTQDEEKVEIHIDVPPSKENATLTTQNAPETIVAPRETWRDAVLEIITLIRKFFKLIQ